MTKIISTDGRFVMEMDEPTPREEAELYARIAGAPITILRGKVVCEVRPPSELPRQTSVE